MQPDIGFALELADLADVISMERFRARDLIVTAKADMTPVTEADHLVEQTLRDRIAARFPDHAVTGEEFGRDGGDGSAWRWVIDPIDGTRSFVRGNETWATLIALRREGRTVLSVASAPAMRLRYRAERGSGAFMNDRPIHVSE